MFQTNGCIHRHDGIAKKKSDEERNKADIETVQILPA